MTTNQVARLMAVAAGFALVTLSSSALAEDAGRGGAAASGARAGGGARMSLPAPRMGFGGGGSLLYRGGSSPRPNMEYRGTGGGSGGIGWGGGRGPIDRPMPRADGPMDPRTGRPMTGGPYYDNGNGTGLEWDRDRGHRGQDGNGVHFDGSYRDDHFRLKWHVGPDCNKHNIDCYPGYRWRYPLYNYWNSWWFYNSYYPGYDYTVYSGPWYGTDPFLTTGQPAAAQPAQTSTSTTPSSVRALTPIELADIAWQNGDMRQAINQFKEYIAGAPDDLDALRYLALAYIDDRKLDEAVAMMAMAYERMPQLASRPLPSSDVPGGDAQMRRRVNAMSGYANRTKTGSAWLTLAVLIQSEGRESAARPIVDRAARAGLNPKVVTEMTAAMGN